MQPTASATSDAVNVDAINVDAINVDAVNFDAVTLAAALGKKFPPTPEQAAVIEGPLGPKLVVAGAGAGKTETMASRVVYLVANGLVKPEEVLGLTFTKKAAQQLEQRIRTQLATLRDSGIIAPGSPVAEALRNLSVKGSTYDAYAGELVREYGLLESVEPGLRVITDAENYAIAHEVVRNFRGELGATQSVHTVVKTVLALSDALAGGLVDTAFVAEHERDFTLTLANLPPATTKTEYSKKNLGYLNTQRLRLQYLPVVNEFLERKQDLGVSTFGEMMAVAARLAQNHPRVGASQRQRYKVILLDEYQDTSHAQRVLLRGLFGGSFHPGVSVTAVGDPMQAIYGWRGATVENLQAFVEDFPQADGTPAPKDQLTVSWRNPRDVLALANDVATGLFAGKDRPVDPLSSRDGAPDGEVSLAYYASEAEEYAAVAADIKARYDRALAAGTPQDFDAAVLVRGNKDAIPMAQRLAELGVPHEILGAGGLLSVPEVQDMLAIATLLVRPNSTRAALRVLTGPLCGLGLDDLYALDNRVRTLAGAAAGRTRKEDRLAQASAEQDTTNPSAAEPEGPEGPEELSLAHLKQQLEDLSVQGPDFVPGLGDAVADLAEASHYSAQGRARLEDLAANLRHLRTYSLGKPLVDLFMDIESVFNIRTEVLTRGGAGGAVQLDTLAEVVAGFPGNSLQAFLDYIELAREQEKGLVAGEVPKAPGRVQIMTVHKSKGLEFRHVYVVRADSNTYGAKAETFLTKVETIPAEDDVIEPLPKIKKQGGQEVEVEPTRKQFEEACDAFIQEMKEYKGEESARLFYVAMTRAEESVFISGSGTNNFAPGHASKKRPYEYFTALAQAHPEHVVHWEVPDKPAEEEADALQTATFPYLEPQPAVVKEAQALRELLGAHAEQDSEKDAEANTTESDTAPELPELPELAAGEEYEQWEREATALIEEHLALQAPVVQVPRPLEMTATQMVAIAKSPEDFARRQRRPVPYKPNSYAKRGTAFHAWLERQFGAPALLDEDELPGIGEQVPAEDLETLKEAFLSSEWATRTPYRVEAPFAFSLGGHMLRGRMDAVFQEPDGSWLVVDWKTGRKPVGKELDDVALQLAVYALAWRKLTGTQAPVRAAFHYVATNETYEPEHLLGEEELMRLL